jgi:hypothetical protein
MQTSCEWIEMQAIPILKRGSMAMQIMKQSAFSYSLLGKRPESWAILAVLAPSLAWLGASKAAAQEAQEAKEQPKAQGAETQKPTAVALENWQKTILKTPRPKNDKCYTAKYPDKEWTEVPCVTPVVRKNSV